MSLVHNFLKEQLLPYYDKENGSFKPYIQELFLTKEGWIDKAYIMRLTKQHMSTTSFRKVVKEVFGVASFKLVEVKEEVTKEDFLKHYEFGKHPFGRGWIQEIYDRTGKVITREKVYSYIMSTSPDRSNSSFAGGIADNR